MIPIPSLPTDNLYKFGALCGIFLFALCTTLCVYIIVSLDEGLIEAEVRSEKLLLVTESLNNDSNYLQKWGKYLSEKQEILSSDFRKGDRSTANLLKSGLQLAHEYDSLIKKSDMQKKLSDDIDMKALDNKGYVKLLRSRINMASIIARCLLLFAFVSILASGFCFKKWYALQQLLDKVTLYEANKLDNKETPSIIIKL